MVKGAVVLQWTMTVAGFLLTAGIILWETFLLIGGGPTTMMYNWPVLVIGVILFLGGCSCFLTKPGTAETPKFGHGESPREF